MVTRIENINSDIINWAITRAGNSLEEFYADNPDVLDWIEGNKKPAIKQLENFTHKVHVPFGYMFMNEPPKEEIPIPFFRTGAAPRDKVSLNVYHTIQIIKDRQNWLTNYLQESDYPDLGFVGKYNDDSDYKEIANDIRNTLKLPVNWASKLGTWEQALDYLTLQIEEIGIIINFNGIVGNNTRRKIIFAIILLNTILSFAQNDSANRDVNKNKGFFNITKIGYVTNTSVKQELFIEGEGNIFSELDKINSHAWSLQTINGYFISPYLSLGIAIGLDGYHNPNFNTLPFMLDIRTYMSDEEDSFYAFLDIGPLLRIGGENSELRKGMAFNIGVGYKFKVAKKLFLISDLSYSHKTVSLTNEGIGTSDNIIKTNGVGLNIGIIF